VDQPTEHTYATRIRGLWFHRGAQLVPEHRPHWELTAPWHHAPVGVSALFIAGDRELDFVPGGRQGIEALEAVVPNLRQAVVLPGCGHWVQQERPAEVSAAMIQFLRSLP
jgi:pimeloyl-ACP methyl ester carboxylesterase